MWEVARLDHVHLDLAVGEEFVLECFLRGVLRPDDTAFFAMVARGFVVALEVHSHARGDAKKGA